MASARDDPIPTFYHSKSQSKVFFDNHGLSNLVTAGIIK